MEVVHPESLDDVGGQCPDTVTLGGTIYPCSDGESFEVSRGQAEALAGRYGVELSDIRVGGTCDATKSDGEVCGRELPCPYHD